MTGFDAFRLAREIACAQTTVRHYCRARGFVFSTVVSRAFRAGVNLGAAVRAYRVRQTEDYATSHAVALGRAACETGWSSAQAFSRARRTVRAWPEWELTGKSGIPA